MPSTFLKIENALKRANEFIDVGKRGSALETLCDAIRAKRHRSWQKCHEEIMFKYLELSVDLRKSYVAKEGIFQYKLICQQTNIKSFEDVVKRYIQLSEDKAEWARNRSAANAINEVDDLDIVQTPEDILLSAVSSEDSQDRTDRVKLIPWVRFLWEAYRQCLDLLKNNVRTEALYHEIAHQAFHFCVKYNRKTEFRKLCDNLRTHMDYLKKTHLNAQQSSHGQNHMVNLNNAESLAMHLETRLIQLESATQIELWQEAYRATDDIKRYGLMNLNKKPPKPQLMANYYQKLSLVFWKANCHLFHAAALFRLFHLTRELKKSITSEDVQRMASRLVIATLTIPIPPNRPDIDKLVDTEENIVENHQRNLASLLGLNTTIPTRAHLIKDLKRMGYLQHAYPPLQELYRAVEVDFHPLALCGRVQSVIEFMEKCDDCPDLRNYVPALKDIAILRLLKEVSQVYQTIEYKRLVELCPFADSIYLETMVVEAARRNDLQVRIDHRKGCLHFGTELCVSQAEEVIEGPHLQSMPSEQVRLQLVSMYSTLLKARSMIEPQAIETQRNRISANIMNNYARRKDIEHDQILARQHLIEERKKQLELLGHKMEQEERLRQEARQRKLIEEETQRMHLERENRERLRKNKEQAERTTLLTKEQIERSGLKEYEGMNDEEIAKVRLEDIKDKRLEQVKKEQKEQHAKQRRLERKIDHFERAKRIEEIPLLEKEYEKWQESDKEKWEECERQRIADLKAERELALTLCERLHKFKEEADLFSGKVNERHQTNYEKKMIEFNAKFEEEKRLRLEARKLKRREDRRAQYYKELELAEKHRLEQIEAEKEKERQLELRRTLEKQQARLKELEAREEADRLARERENTRIRIDAHPPARQPEADSNWRRSGPPAPGPTYVAKPRDGHEMVRQNMPSRDQLAGEFATDMTKQPVRPSDAEVSWRRSGPPAPAPSAPAYVAKPRDNHEMVRQNMPPRDQVGEPAPDSVKPPQTRRVDFDAPRRGDFDAPRRGDSDGPPPRRPDFEGPPPRRPDFDGPPPRRGDFDGPPSRRPDFDGPPRRGGFDGPPPRRGGFDGPPRRGGFDGPPRRGGFDGPPPRRGGFDDPPRRGGFDDPPRRGGFDDPARVRADEASNWRAIPKPIDPEREESWRKKETPVQKSE